MTSTSDRLAILRILDADYDRASEGLRVLEEYARYALDDRFLSGELKELRHGLTAAIQSIAVDELLAARETSRDVGTRVTAVDEYQRADLAEVVRANFQRVQQALRAMEEYAKVLSGEVATRIEALRYRTYTLEKALVRASTARDKLHDCRLYVLLDSRGSLDVFERLVVELLAAGVDALQLRDKSLDDRTLLTYARKLRELTRGTQTLFIVNDRPDLAALSHADGVHVGQEELPVHEVRKIVGTQCLIGVSTHNIEQARQAVLDGADYLGCGPTFPSGTKSFASFPGVSFLREVAGEIALPAFAIGGINTENVGEVVAAGFTRVAVSGAVTGATSPSEVIKELRQRLIG